MFGIIKNIFMGLLINIVSASNHTKYVLLSNPKCEIQPTFINLHPNLPCGGLNCKMTTS